MLRYSDDRRYILQKNARTGKITKTLGPYKPDMIPEIKDNFGKDRHVESIPQTSEESVYYQYPDLRDEFIRFTDPKYKKLTLKDVKGSCGFKAEFQCNTCGHKQITTMQNRTKGGQECSHCCKQHISFPEKYVYYALKQVDSNLQENYRISNSQLLEFDMYDPALKFAIEFNAENNHQINRDSDEKKLQYALSKNIRLIRIWQILSVKQVDKLNKNEYIVPHKNSINIVPDLNIIIDDICQQYNLDQSLIDRKQAQDQAFIRTNKIPPAGESLLDLYPDICRDWDYNKNGVIRPELLKPASGIKVWWTCFYCGKSWNVSVHQRTAMGMSHRAGCIQCNTRIGKGIMKEIPYIPYK